MKESFSLLDSFINDFAIKISNGQELWMRVLIHLVIAISIIVISFIVGNMIRKSSFLFKSLGANATLTDLVQQTVAIIFKILGLILALQVLGAGSLVGAVLGTAGVIGLGISFAFKDIVENYIAGIILSIRQPFLKGDHVVIDGSEGIIQRMTTRMTMIKSFDGNNISIPNANVFKSKITNYSKNPLRRFTFAIGIDPSANPNDARAIGLDVMEQLESVQTEPAPMSLISNIGDSSIALDFYGWVDQQEFDFGQARSEAIAMVKEAIEEHGIDIPDPSYVIKIKNLPDDLSEKSGPKKMTKDHSKLSSRYKEAETVEKQIESEKAGAGLLTDARTE